MDFVLTHILLIIFIAGSFVLWLLVNTFSPGFFDPFKHWCLTDNIPLAILQNWPLLLYALALALISLKTTKKVKAKEILLAQDVYTSVMAGILEEIGYRCFFIFTAMIPIAIIDFLLFGVATWIYKVITFPIVNFLTLGLMGGFATAFNSGRDKRQRSFQRRSQI